MSHIIKEISCYSYIHRTDSDYCDIFITLWNKIAKLYEEIPTIEQSEFIIITENPIKFKFFHKIELQLEDIYIVYNKLAQLLAEQGIILL